MGTNKSDVSNLVRIIELGDQSVLVAGNVKDNPVPTDNAGTSELSFHIIRISPLCMFHKPVPGSERSSTVGILWFIPKLPDRFPGNYPQWCSSERL